MTNCPNCGAVITGNVCEYCGTTFANIVERGFVQTSNSQEEEGGRGFLEAFYAVKTAPPLTQRR